MSQHISGVSLDNSLPSAELRLTFWEDFKIIFLCVLYKAQEIAVTCFAGLQHSLDGPSPADFDVCLELIFSPYLTTFFPFYLCLAEAFIRLTCHDDVSYGVERKELKVSSPCAETSTETDDHLHPARKIKVGMK